MHTQGKWEIANYGKHYEIQAEVEKGRFMQIAVIKDFGDNDGTPNIPVLANAKLIAAAPDLLESCEELLDFARKCPGCSLRLRKAQQAIDKAK